jgi:hypothetical protein
MPFCLQASFSMAVTDMEVSVIQPNHQELNIRVRKVTVSFMNNVDVTVVVTVLANFQIQIVPDL